MAKRRTSIEYKGANPDLTIGMIRDAKKEMLSETLKYWYRDFLPLHFTSKNRSRYKHKRRTRNYEIRKAKAPYFSRTDLVRSGETKKQAEKGGIRIKATGTAKKTDVKGILKVPKYNFYISKYGNRIDKIQELTTFAQTEEEQMEDFYADELDRVLAKGDQVTTTKYL